MQIGLATCRAKGLGLNLDPDILPRRFAIAERCPLRPTTSLPREAPRLCRGGSRSLTFHGVPTEDTSNREPPST